MSVLEDLQQAQQRVVDRLQELEPLAAEYERLRQEANRLGLKAATSAASTAKKSAGRTARASSTAKRAAKRTSETSKKSVASKERTPVAAAPAATSAASPTAKPSRGGKRAGAARTKSGGRAEDVARLVAQRPGVTVKDLGAELGVNPTGLYAPVRQLVEAGKLTKNGSKLAPAKS